MRPNRKMPGWKVIFCVLTTILVAGACSSDQSAAAGEGCVINTDCSSPLVCAFRKCHMACTDTRDCPPSQRCMASDRPFHVCQLPQETKCGYNSDCPNGQICAVDGQCRDQCASDRDCVSRQICTAASCAEIVELDDAGTLPVVVTDEAGAPSTGQPCQYNSDCPGDQICRSSGLCAPECLHDRDCPAGSTCGESGRCTANATSSGAGGNNANAPDATVGGADATTGGPDVAAGGTCANKIKDGTETDVDCGGTCPPCATGSGCTGSNDCASGKCDTRVCQLPTCSDTIKNGSETAIDCGGTCDPCPNGMGCSKGTDCATGLCIGSTCHALDCTDGQHDGDETDVDCGGARCPKCDNQKVCGANPDCKSDFCSGDVCQATGCNDGRKSGSETDVDCGGLECKKCAAGQACGAPGDCATGVCTGLVCQGSKCDDKIKNGSETDVDCGGGCVTCVAGMKCVRGTDCASGACTAGVCKATFSLTVVPAGGGSGRVTSTPTGIDCGATCVASIAAGTGVELSATPSLNSAFAGWTGAGCTGSSTCLVTMNSSQSVTATFSPSTAGAVNWSKVMTTISTDAGYLVAFDPQGSLFVAGTFSGAFDFGAGLVTSVGQDLFIAKYSSSGAYQWARHFSGSLVSANAIAVDANGDVYLAGQFVSTISLGNGSLTCAAGAAYYQGFIAKYIGSGAMQGTFAWQHCMGSPGSTATTSAVTTTPTGEVLVAGDVSPGGIPADFGGMTLTGLPGSFVARYASGDGTLTSLKKPLSSPGGGATHAYSIAADASGNIVIGGSFTYSADFGNGSIVSINSLEDAFIAKLKPDTSYMWSKNFGDVGTDRVTGVAVDAAGNVAYAGSFFGQIDIGAVETSAGDRDIVVGKCAAADGAYLWGRRFGGPNADLATGIAMNADGDVVFTGAIGGSVDFGGGPLTTFGGTDIFVAKFFANKSYAWSNSWGSVGDDIGYGVAFNASGAVGIAGVVSGLVDFGDVAPRYGASTDAFLLKLTP